MKCEVTINCYFKYNFNLIEVGRLNMINSDIFNQVKTAESHLFPFLSTGEQNLYHGMIVELFFTQEINSLFIW